MNIIIEGPDASGKTLYTSEVQKYGYTYMKCSPGEHSSVSNLDYDYFSNLLNLDNYVFDRFCVSELVYSELYNRDKVITFSEVNKLLSNNIDNIKIIFLYSSDTQLLKDRVKERNEINYIDELDDQNRLFVNYAWVFLAYESDNIYFIDINKYNTIDDVKKIVSDIIKGE